MYGISGRYIVGYLLGNHVKVTDPPCLVPKPEPGRYGGEDKWKYKWKYKCEYKVA